MQLTEAGQAVQSGVTSAMEYIKEHLPKVVHEEETPTERQSRALLDEAMGRTQDIPTDITDVTPTGTAGTAKVESTAPGTTAAETPGVGGTSVSTRVQEEAVAEANRLHAASLVERANEAAGGMGSTADAALSAPTELKAEMDERSAKTPLQVLEEKMEGAKEYVR